MVGGRISGEGGRLQPLSESLNTPEQPGLAQGWERERKQKLYKVVGF